MINKLRAAWLWTIGGTGFGLVMVFMLICTYIFKPERYDPWIKKLARFLFRLLGIRVTVSGLDRFDHNETYLFMANHVNIFDVPLLQGYIPQLIRGVEAERQFKWPIYGWAVRRAGNIPINRKDVQKAIPSANEAAKRLQEGRSIAIMPEGHRTRTGRLGSFKKLPFHLARQGGRPIVPMGLSGLYKIKKRGNWVIVPGPVHVAFGDPIPPDVIRELPVEELRIRVREAISSLVQEENE